MRVVGDAERSREATISVGLKLGAVRSGREWVGELLICRVRW